MLRWERDHGIEMENVVPSTSDICQGGRGCVTAGSSGGCPQNPGRAGPPGRGRWRPHVLPLPEGSDLPSRARVTACVSSNCTQPCPRNRGLRSRFLQAGTCDLIQAGTCDVIPLRGGELTPFPWTVTSEWNEADTSPKNPREGRGARRTLPFSLPPSLGQAWGRPWFISVAMWRPTLRSGSGKVGGTLSRAARKALEPPWQEPWPARTHAPSDSASLGAQRELQVLHLMHLKAHPGEKTLPRWQRLTGRAGPLPPPDPWFCLYSAFCL